jgi:hypothetical protein
MPNAARFGPRNARQNNAFPKGPMPRIAVILLSARHALRATVDASLREMLEFEVHASAAVAQTATVAAHRSHGFVAQLIFICS